MSVVVDRIDQDNLQDSRSMRDLPRVSGGGSEISQEYSICMSGQN